MGRNYLGQAIGRLSAGAQGSLVIHSSSFYSCFILSFLLLLLCYICSPHSFFYCFHCFSSFLFLCFFFQPYRAISCKIQYWSKSFSIIIAYSHNRCITSLISFPPCNYHTTT